MRSRPLDALTGLVLYDSTLDQVPVRRHPAPRHQTRLGEPALLTETVPLRSGLTPYARSGDGPPVALAVVALAAPTMLGVRRRTARAVTEPGPRHRPGDG